MYLENVVTDALDPQRVGRFWEAVIDGEQLTDEEAGYETRLEIAGGPVLDLCFQRVDALPDGRSRLHLDLGGGPGQDAEVERLLGLGAQRLDIGQGDAPWVVLADPEGSALCVLEERASYSGTGPVAAFAQQSADPARDLEFWAWLTGWTPVSDGTGDTPAALRHPSLLGPLLEFLPEPAPKGPAKNRTHLDIRLEGAEDADSAEAAVLGRGARRLHPGWGELPWRSYLDPSGNEFCLLPSRG